MKDQDKQRIKSYSVNKGFRYIWAAGSVLMLTIGILWWKWNQDSPPENGPPSEAPAASTVPVAGNAIRPAPINLEQRLFAAHFRPFQMNQLGEMIQVAPKQSSFQYFAQAYLDGQYEAVLRTFEALDEADKSNLSILFLKANALLALNQSEVAIGILNKICTEKSYPYLADAQWYLALAWLQKGDWVHAGPVLQSINSTDRHPYAPRAHVLLNAYSRRATPGN